MSIAGSKAMVAAVSERISAISLQMARARLNCLNRHHIKADVAHTYVTQNATTTSLVSFYLTEVFVLLLQR